MKSYEKLDQETRNGLAKVLEDAADDIVEFGWTNQPYQYEDNSPTCVYLAAERRRVASDYCSYSTYGEYIQDALIESAGLNPTRDYMGNLFDLNDSKSNEEGQAWAYDVLLGAANLMRGVPVNTSRATITTQSTDSGNTQNVIVRLGQWLKKFVWVR